MNNVSKYFRLYFVGAAILSILFLFSCEGKKKQNVEKLEKVTIAAYSGDTSALIYIAHDLGLFEKNGLQIKLKEFTAGKIAMDALLAGEAQIATCADFVFTRKAFEHSDLRILASVANADLNAVLGRKDHGIEKPSDLKGKKIGITVGSVCSFLIGEFLLMHGLDKNDVQIVNLTPPKIVKAMIEGKIDACVTWEPNVFEIKKALGENLSIWQAQHYQDFYFVLASKEKWLRKNKTAAEKLLAALLSAQKYLAENPESVKSLLAGEFELSKEYIEYVWPKQIFTVELSQGLLLTLEDQAQWMLDTHRRESEKIPDLYSMMAVESLDKVANHAVTLIR